MSFVRCELCNISVNTPEQLSYHKQGKQHIKKLRTAQFLESVNGKAAASTSSIRVPSESHNSMDRSQGVPQLTSRISTLSLNFTCELCEKTCNTMEQLELHKAGSQHRRKLALQNPKALPPEDEYTMKYVDGITQFHCSICPNTWCATLTELESHRRGINHCKRQAARAKPKPLDFDRRPGGAVGRPNMSSLELHCPKCDESLPNASYLHSHVCNSRFAVQTSRWPTLPDDSAPKETLRIAGDCERGSNSFSGSLSDDASTQLPVFYKPSSSSFSSSDSFVFSKSGSLRSHSSTPAFDTAVLDKVVIQEGDQEYACLYCNLICNTPKAMEAHLSGGKHKKRARRLGKPVSIDGSETDRLDSCQMTGNEVVRCSGEMVRCLVCDLKVNVNNLESHLAGKKHAEKKVKSGRFPSCSMLRPPMIQSVKLESWTGNDTLVKNWLKEEPRRYQWELFVKSMMRDAVVYLPTGTGKTLVAALTIGEMLARNPHYQAVFLVDKTLLALQQSSYLREQLANLTIPRFDLETKKVETRKPLIACLCGDMHDLEGDKKSSLWQQDVIVTTVGFYLNLLQSGITTLDQVCLVVMDEAHHCVKEHPFHRLLRDYHNPLPAERRPKLLGLTASPAGAETLEDTQTQLRTLLKNLGDIEVVATEHATEELSFFTNLKNTRCVVIPMESLERDLQFHLLRFALEVLSSALPGSTHVASLRRELSSQVPNVEIILKMLEQQSNECRERSADVADVVNDSIDSYFKLESGDWELASIDVEKVCRAADHFENCSPELTKAVKGLKASVAAIKVSTASGLHISPVLRCLTQAVEANLRRQGGESKDMVIVLTSQRSIARSVTDYLSSHLDENVVCLVGHGSTSGATQKQKLGEHAELTRGMTVQQQRSALTKIGKMHYRVVVATSVAEEGVDLPACGLVILLSPPTNMSAVVQMRGRARLKNSHFVVLCREESQREKFKLLLKREDNMFCAVKEMCREQAQGRDE